MNTAPKFLFILTAVAALSLAYPASVQAVPTTYQYTGNPFTFATGPYTTSMFVTAMVTLAGPLAPNTPFTQVFPTAFSLSDGVQTLTNPTSLGTFFFATDATGNIVQWHIVASADPTESEFIGTHNDPIGRELDIGLLTIGSGSNLNSPGVWSVNASVPDTGSTLSLMTLTLMALGLVARRFQRPARSDRARGGRSSLLAFRY